MAVIKIPSSNIYGVGGDTDLIFKNQFGQVDIPVQRFQSKVGNVLDDQYVATYYKEPIADDVEFVGTLPNTKNFVYFNGELSALGLLYTIAMYGANSESPEGAVFGDGALFGVDKIVKLKKSTSGDVEGFTVSRHKQYVDLSKEKDDPKRHYSKTINDSEKLKHIFGDNAFKYSLNTDKINNSSVIALGGELTFSTPESDTSITINTRLLSETITIEGTYYEPTQVLKSQGNSKTNSLSLPSNELVQENSTLNETTPLSTDILQNVFKNYSQGKEVHTIKCSVSKYYDTNGEISIDPNNSIYSAVFQKHDIIEPYVFTNEGEVPLSKKSDGTPKRFQIIGIDYSYAGVVWQELTIQEYIE